LSAPVGWLVVASVGVGTVLAAGPGAAAPTGATVDAVVQQTAPAPPLPAVAGVDTTTRTTPAPVSDPAAGSTSTGAWTVWTGVTGHSTATRMSMPPATGAPLLGDWNGDGLATPGRYDNGQWFVTNAAVDSAVWEPYLSFGGDPGDVPVVGRIDKDRRADVGVFRNGTWIWHLTNGRPDRTDQFGAAGDIPIVGDWDGDGRDDLGVVRGGAWILRITGRSTKPSWVGRDVQVQPQPVGEREDHGVRHAGRR